MIWTSAHVEQHQANFREFVSGAIGVLEASSCEYSYVYQRCLASGREISENLSGFSETVGYIEKRPICISLRQLTIDGHKIIVYDATSTLVDWDMIRAWLEENMPDTAFEVYNDRARLNNTNADNWSNILPRKKVAA